MWLSLLGLVCGYVSKRINSLELESTAIDAGCTQTQKSTTKVGHETRSAILLYPSEQKVVHGAICDRPTGRKLRFRLHVRRRIVVSGMINAAATSFRVSSVCGEVPYSVKKH